MGSTLLKVDKSVVIIHPPKNHNPVFSSFLQNIEVFKFKVLSENILRKANTIIWQFPGVTSVEVKGDHQLQVIGEFNNVDMWVKLTEIDKSVNMVKAGAKVEAPPQKNVGYRNSFSAMSRGQAKEETNNKPLVGVARRRELPLEAAERELANRRAMGKAKEYEDLFPQKKGAFGAQNNRHLPIKQKQEEGGFLAKMFDNKKPQQDGWNFSRRNAELHPFIEEKPELEKTQAPTQGTSSYSSTSWNPSRSNQSSSFGDSSRSNQSSSFGDSSRSNLSSSFGHSSRSNQPSNSVNPYLSLAGMSGSTTTQTQRRKH
jgi:hypothetical protein